MGQLAELRRSQNLLWNLTLRELRAKYRRSFLGWAWSMLNPLSNMLIYWFVFGVVFGATAPRGEPSGLQVYAFQQKLLHLSLATEFAELLVDFLLCAS
ncbi:MAG: hypothetical protein EBY93_06255 [Actinobacteria bacterium]|nr:hypothetical protein [Actinomycetota bacterium]